MNDKQREEFCAPIWERLESVEIPSGQFPAISEILGQEPDTFYMSELDLSLFMALVDQPIVDRATGMAFESSYRLFELSGPPPKPPKEKDRPSRLEFRRRQFHAYQIDPFQYLPDTAESRAVFDGEISWYRTSIDALRTRVSTYSQLDADTKTVNCLITSLFFLHIEHAPMALPIPERLQLVVPEIRRRFVSRLHFLARLDLAGLASASQLRDLSREFSDENPTNRQLFVKNFATKVSSIGRLPLSPLLRRYHRLGQTYDSFEAAAFLQTMSGIPVQLESVEVRPVRFAPSAATPPPPELAVLRQLFAEVLARRRRFADPVRGGRRLRGHDVVAVGYIAEVITGAADGCGVLHAVVESFDVPQRKEIVECLLDVITVARRAVEKLAVEFDGPVFANLQTVVGWMEDR
jgi:hypothetical protein